MRQIVSTLFPDPERAARAARTPTDDRFGRHAASHRARRAIAAVPGVPDPRGGAGA